MEAAAAQASAKRWLRPLESLPHNGRGPRPIPSPAPFSPGARQRAPGRGGRPLEYSSRAGSSSETGCPALGERPARLKTAAATRPGATARDPPDHRLLREKLHEAAGGEASAPQRPKKKPLSPGHVSLRRARTLRQSAWHAASAGSAWFASPAAGCDLPAEGRRSGPRAPVLVGGTEKGMGRSAAVVVMEGRFAAFHHDHGMDGGLAPARRQARAQLAEHRILAGSCNFELDRIGEGAWEESLGIMHASWAARPPEQKVAFTRNRLEERAQAGTVVSNLMPEACEFVVEKL